MLRLRRHVMRDPRQRIVDPLCGEACQRGRAVRVAPVLAIDDLVVDRGEVGHIEHVAQGEIERAVLRNRHAASPGQCEVHGDRGVRDADEDRFSVVLEQQPDLLFQIVPEQMRLRDRRRIDARPGDMAEGEPRVGERPGGDRKPDLGVAGADAARGATFPDDLVEAVDEKINCLLIEFDQPGYRRLRIGETLVQGDWRRVDQILGHAFSSNRSVTSNRVTSTRPISEMRSSGITTSARSECCM